MSWCAKQDRYWTWTCFEQLFQCGHNWEISVKFIRVTKPPEHWNGVEILIWISLSQALHNSEGIWQTLFKKATAAMIHYQQYKHDFTDFETNSTVMSSLQHKWSLTWACTGIRFPPCCATLTTNLQGQARSISGSPAKSTECSVDALQLSACYHHSHFHRACLNWKTVRIVILIQGWISSSVHTDISAFICLCMSKTLSLCLDLDQLAKQIFTPTCRFIEFILFIFFAFASLYKHTGTPRCQWTAIQLYQAGSCEVEKMACFCVCVSQQVPYRPIVLGPSTLLPVVSHH